MLGWHAPRGDKIVFGGDDKAWNKMPEPTPLVPLSSELASEDVFPYILVMRRGRQSAFHAVLSQRIAGQNVRAVKSLARDIAEQVRVLHEHVSRRCVALFHSCIAVRKRR